MKGNTLCLFRLIMKWSQHDQDKLVIYMIEFAYSLNIMSTIYEVEEILDQAILNNQPHYLIKWKNFGHENDTWEPLSQLSNIIEYLQHWLTKRRNKENLKRDGKGQSFSSIKTFLYAGELISRKQMTKKQYEKQIMTCDKICDKDIKYKGECKEPDKSNFFKREQRRKAPSKARQIIEEKKNIKQQQKSELSQEEQQLREKQDSDNFKVVGEIDTAKVEKIIKCFNWNHTRCLQVQLGDGKCFNMVENDLRLVRPQLLIDFYESNGIPF